MSSQKYILIISTCTHKLHENEFLLPVISIVKSLHLNYQTTHLSTLEKEKHLTKNIQNISKIIICGTALLDFEYEQFSMLEAIKKCNSSNIEIFGICAGAQLIATAHNITLPPLKKIGISNLIPTPFNSPSKLFNQLNSSNTLQAYTLHSKVLHKSNLQHNITPLLILEENPNYIEFCSITNPTTTPSKNTTHYLAFFHPEIKQKEILKNWILN